MNDPNRDAGNPHNEIQALMEENEELRVNFEHLESVLAQVKQIIDLDSDVLSTRKKVGQIRKLLGGSDD